MKCTTCGQALSLRMARCATCGTPTSYAATQQSSSFAASQSATQLLAGSESYEQRGYAQPSQHGQESGINNASAVGPTAQAMYSTYTPIQQPLSVGYMSAQKYAISPTYNAPPLVLMKKRRWGNFFLLVIVVCILLLFSIGMYKLIRIANATSTAKQANTPSGNVLVPAAAVILKDAQTSSDIDNTLAPTHITKTFMANQKVYVTFTIASGKQDGSIEAKWYEDGQVVATTIFPHMHENTHGVFSDMYITATPDGAVELYWCTQPDCKDAQLAQVVHFVVTPVNLTPVVWTDVSRPGNWTWGNSLRLADTSPHHPHLWAR